MDIVIDGCEIEDCDVVRRLLYDLLKIDGFQPSVVLPSVDCSLANR